MTLFEREQLAGVEDDVGVGDAAVGQVRRRIWQFAAEALAEECAAGIMLGLPFRGADPAVAVARATILQVESVQHAVADEPVRAGYVELWIGTVAIERPVQFARQLADDLQERRVGLERDGRAIGRHLAEHILLHGGFS